VNAALVVMEREGFSGLTLRSLANELKVATSLLYNYFERVEDIENEAIQRLAATLPLPVPGKPRQMREQLIESLIAGRAVLVKHPGVLNPPLGSAAWNTFSDWGVQWILALTPFAVNQSLAASGHTALIAMMAMSAERERLYGTNYHKKLERVRDRRLQQPADPRVAFEEFVDVLFPGFTRAHK
jgi:AcrR family transcriptional regulator